MAGQARLPTLLTYRSELDRQLGRPEDALTDATEALRQAQEAAQPKTRSATVGAAYLALGKAQQAKGNIEDATASYRSAAEHLENALDPDHPDSRSARQLSSGGGAVAAKS